jgi:hypothetical protein
MGWLRVKLKYGSANLRMPAGSTGITDDRRNEYRKFDPSTIADFLGHRTIESSQRISTGKSNTNIKLILSDGQSVVVRLYGENAQSSPEREKVIIGIIGDVVPIPKMLSNGDDWAVFDFVEGRLLEAHPEHSQAAAQVIAALSKIRFDKNGWITEMGEVVPFGFGDDYSLLKLGHQEVRQWLGEDRIASVGMILSIENARLRETNEQASLTHGDFNPTNILIHDGKVNAVLDWEYGHAGTPYMDIGNLLRNTAPTFHDLIGQGLIDGGFDLPADWRERAALVDLSSHLEFLTSTRTDEFKRTRVELVDSFISMFHN